MIIVPFNISINIGMQQESGYTLQLTQSPLPRSPEQERQKNTRTLKITSETQYSTFLKDIKRLNRDRFRKFDIIAVNWNQQSISEGNFQAYLKQIRNNIECQHLEIQEVSPIKVESSKPTAEESNYRDQGREYEMTAPTPAKSDLDHRADEKAQQYSLKLTYQALPRPLNMQKKIRGLKITPETKYESIRDYIEDWSGFKYFDIIATRCKKMPVKRENYEAYLKQLKTNSELRFLQVREIEFRGEVVNEQKSKSSDQASVVQKPDDKDEPPNTQYSLRKIGQQKKRINELIQEQDLDQFSAPDKSISFNEEGSSSFINQTAEDLSFLETIHIVIKKAQA